ncbi:hypothetical protein ACFE04_014837 [Oxalis oulophora]
MPPPQPPPPPHQITNNNLYKRKRSDHDVNTMDSFGEFVNKRRLGFPNYQPSVSLTRRNLLESQRTNLLVSLKPQLAKLCHVLNLQDDVANTAQEFLDYVINNHVIDREPDTMLQALQLSVCWIAASLRKHHVCHKESRALAKDHLNFGCTKAEGKYVNSQLCCLKNLFLHFTRKLEVSCSPKSSESDKDQLRAVCSQADSQNSNEDVENLPYDLNNFLFEMMPAPGFQHVKKEFLMSINYIKQKSKMQLNKFLQKYGEEMKKVEEAYAQKKEKLENQKKTETSVIRLQFKGNISTRAQKLKILDNEYEKKFEDLKCEREIDVKRIVAQHLAAMKTVRENEADWVEGMKSWAKCELANLPLDINYKGVTMQDSEDIVCEMGSSKAHDSTSDFVGAVTSLAPPHGDKHGLNAAVLEVCEGQNGSVPVNVSSDEKIHAGELPDLISQVDTDNSAQRTKGSTEHLSDNGDHEKYVEDTSSTSICDREVPSSVPKDVGSREKNSDGNIAYVCNPEVPSAALPSENGISVKQPVSGVEVVPEVPTSNKDKSGLHAVVSDNRVQDCSQVEVDSSLAAANKENSGSRVEASDNLVEDIPHVEDSVPSQGRIVEESSLADSQPLTNLPQVGQLLSSQTKLDVASSELQPDQEISHSFVVQELRDIISASGTGGQLFPEDRIANQVTETPMQVDQVRGFPVMASAPQVHETRILPSTSGTGFQERAVALLASLMHPPTMSQDPLQNEHERIQKEIERTVKSRDESKTRILSIRDQELQNAKAQIQAKYNTKTKAIDAELKMKMNEVDMKYERVVLNKMLAEALRLKSTYITQPPYLQLGMYVDGSYFRS